MIVNRLDNLHAQVAQPYRALCQAATLAYPTFMRWRGRLASGQPVLQKPGPKPVGSLDLAVVQAQLRELEHGRQRSHGAPALYAEHQAGISRRAFQELLEQARREIQQERQADTRRIQWLVPGAVWSVDPTELVLEQEGQRYKRPVLPVLDLASRYKLPPLVGERLTGDVVAARLDELFQRYGPPLVLKRDNGSNLNSAEVNAVLSRWRVIPLNSPPHYPPYNGGIERAQRDLKSALRPLLRDCPIEELPRQVLWTIHELNHRPRRCLHGQTACQQFAGAKPNLREYTPRRRKELFESIREQAMQSMLESPVRTQGHADAVWRRAVETWLLQNEIITISQPKTVTQFP
jgi:transposase InsO family protein